MQQESRQPCPFAKFETVLSYQEKVCVGISMNLQKKKSKKSNDVRAQAERYQHAVEVVVLEFLPDVAKLGQRECDALPAQLNRVESTQKLPRDLVAIGEQGTRVECYPNTPNSIHFRKYNDPQKTKHYGKNVHIQRHLKPELLYDRPKK